MCVALTLLGAVAMIVAVALVAMALTHKNEKPKLFHADTRLSAHILKECRRLSQPFSPPFWWRSGHAQTVGYAILPNRGNVVFKREYVDLKDGGAVALDWAESHLSDSLQADSPLMIGLCGLTGDAQGFGFLCQRALENGFRAVIFNKRGHGNSRLFTPKLQSFGDPFDLRHVILMLKSRYPSADIFTVGHSAGSGLLASYLGEFGESSHVSGAVGVSAGFNSEELFREGLGIGYDYVIMRSLRQLIAQHADTLASVIDMDAALNCACLEEMELKVYAKMHGYATLTDYWKDNNPMRAINNVQVPIMMLHSMDDPVCRAKLIPYEYFSETHPQALLVRTDRGGHCGFFEGWRLQSWADKVTIDYLKAIRSFKSESLKSE